MDTPDSNALTPVAPGKAANSRRTERLEMYEAPAPGTYWRLSRHVEAASSTSLRCPAMERGTVLMLASLA